MNYIGRWTICNNQYIHRECIRRVDTYWRILSVDSYDPHKQFVARQSYRPYLCSNQHISTYDLPSAMFYLHDALFENTFWNI